MWHPLPGRLLRIATREIAEDFTPLLTEQGGPTVVVLSQTKDDWTACFSSLMPDTEWQLAEAVAVGLEQPTVYAIFSDATETYAYRYFADGVLHEEFLPTGDERLDGAMLSKRLAAHAIPAALIDDRTLTFNEQHLLVAYGVDQLTHPGRAVQDESRDGRADVESAV